MILKPWHREIAKRFAQGKRNKEILQEFRISAGYLSVLKSKPEFQAEVERWSRILDEEFHREAFERYLKQAENRRPRILPK